jgi:hypothetical protein
VSKKQEKFMQAVAHNPAFAKKVGVPVKVGKEFTKSGGGEMKESKAMVKKEVSFMKKKGAPKSMIKHEMKEAGMKKMASGGLAAGHKSADGIAHKGKTKGKEVKMAMGGAALGAAKAYAAGKAAPMLQQAAAASARKKVEFQGRTPAQEQALSKFMASAKNATPNAAAQQGLARAAAAPATNSKQMQFMSNALRGGAMKPPTGGMMGAGQRGLGGMPSKPKAPPPGMNVEAIRAAQRGLGDTFKGTAPKASSLPALGKSIAGLGAAAGKMMGRKAGGLAAGHKEADGIAKKGKTRAMQVKMAGGGKTKKYC